MEYALVLLTLGIVFALYMTWGVGANDVANAMGTSVGSGAITVKKAILIAAIFESGNGTTVLGGGLGVVIHVLHDKKVEFLCDLTEVLLIDP